MNQLIDEQQKTKILTVLNDAADNQVWQQSNFLRVIGKQLQQIRDTFKNMMSSDFSGNQAVKAPPTTEDLKNIPVFISLYSMKGMDLKTWEHILLNLPAQLVARPIYTNEQNVITAIKSKNNPDNEAYIGVTIPIDNIFKLSEDKTPLDKLKQPLLTIKGRPLSNKYEGVFVHSTGRYRYANGKLVKDISS